MILNKKYKIFDIHTHIFPDNIAKKAVESIGRYYNIDMWENGTVDALLESGRQIGVDRYLVHSSETHSGQVKAINDYIAGVINSTAIDWFCTCILTLRMLRLKLKGLFPGLKRDVLHPNFNM